MRGEAAQDNILVFKVIINDVGQIPTLPRTYNPDSHVDLEYTDHNETKRNYNTNKEKKTCENLIMIPC